VKVLLGDGSGGFNCTKELNADGGPVRLLVRDFNKDGRLDIAVNAPDEGAILLYFGDGQGGFVTPPEELEDIPQPFGLAAGDFNRDSSLDIATSTRNGKFADGSHVAILEGDGTGKFSRGSEFQVGQVPTSLQAHDMNNDGILDLLVAGLGRTPNADPLAGEGNFMSSFLGDGDGKFTLKQTLHFGAGNGKFDMAVGDFDEDGDLDVALGQTGIQSDIPTDNLLIFFGDATGKLVKGPTVTVGKEPHTVISADFNKDGHLDLAVTNRTDGTVSVLLGNGTGRFAVDSTFSVVVPTP
jgi:hypothetical protein